jgi:hypothetical protein
MTEAQERNSSQYSPTRTNRAPYKRFHRCLESGSYTGGSEEVCCCESASPNDYMRQTTAAPATKQEIDSQEACECFN